jgi:hypothetical protein
MLEYPAWLVGGSWNMSLAKPLAQSRPNPIAKTFDSYMVHSCCALSGRIKHTDIISNFKQTSAIMNGTTSATFNGTATITINTLSLQNIPISIKLTGNELTLWVDPTKTHAHFGNLDEIPISGSIDKGQ